MQLAGFSLMLVDLERVLPQIIQYVPYKDKDITVKLSAYNQPPFLFKKNNKTKHKPSLDIEQRSGIYREHHKAQISV